MLLRTRIYMRLNGLFGDPRYVSPGTYTRTEEIFEASTVPLAEKFLDRINRRGSLLIVGCGSGLEIRWFAERVSRVVAVDIDPQAVEQSRQNNSALENVECVLVSSETLPFEDDEFDAIFMHDVCEHILELEACFREYHRVLNKDGVLINSFCPLFYSPFGAHFQDALKIPWGHLLFGLQPVIEVRNVYYSGIAEADSWAELGLNRLTERKYRKIVREAGFESEFYEVLISKNLPLVDKIPLLRNLFILGINEVLHVAPSR